MNKHWVNLFYLFIMCVVLIGGFKYIGDRAQKAEIYVCYYDIPPSRNPFEVQHIEPYCLKQNETPWQQCKYCTYKGTTITKGLGNGS